MDKQLLKLYAVIASALALAIAFLPQIVGRTSSLAAGGITRANLLVYNAEGIGTAQPDGGRGCVVIVMDDGWDTQYTRGYAMLSQYGMKASIAVIPAAVGEPEYMDYRQLADLYMEGWDILNHTYSHFDLSSISEEQQAEQVTKGRDWLLSHQLKRGSDILIFPGGSYSDATLKVISDAGVAAARSLKSVWVPSLGCTLDDAEVCNLISSITLERVTAAVDKAVNNKSVLILMLHKIEPVTDESDMQLDEGKFRSILDYIAGKGESISVLTMSEMLMREGISPLGTAGG